MFSLGLEINQDRKLQKDILSFLNDHSGVTKDSGKNKRLESHRNFETYPNLLFS